MVPQKKKFADDLDGKPKPDESTDSGPIKNHNVLEDKWNEIQEEYIDQHPEISTADLYFDGGGFNGMIEKISEISGKSKDAIRKEIQDW